jgi:hypothetical protein
MLCHIGPSWISGRSPQKGGRAPPTIPHSEVALIVNDIFDPMYGYHKGDENKTAEMKNVSWKEGKN